MGVKVSDCPQAQCQAEDAGYAGLLTPSLEGCGAWVPREQAHPFWTESV